MECSFSFLLHAVGDSQLRLACIGYLRSFVAIVAYFASSPLFWGEHQKMCKLVKGLAAAKPAHGLPDRSRCIAVFRIFKSDVKRLRISFSNARSPSVATPQRVQEFGFSKISVEIAVVTVGDSVIKDV